MFVQVYAQGYSSTGIAKILEDCNISKGAFYHYFKSKKELMLCVIEERIQPAVNALFSAKGGYNYQVIFDTIELISKDKGLIVNNCPYNKVNMELYLLDKDFQHLLDKIYISIVDRVTKHLQSSLTLSKDPSIDCHSMAKFILASIWGALSTTHTEEDFKQTVKPLYLFLSNTFNPTNPTRSV